MPRIVPFRFSFRVPSPFLCQDPFSIDDIRKHNLYCCASKIKPLFIFLVSVAGAENES